MSDPREESLPKWAQQIIDKLRYELSEARASVPHGEGLIMTAERFGHEKASLSLDKYSEVIVKPAMVSVSYNVHHNGWAYISAGSMEIKPAAANCVLIRGTRP